MFFKKTLSVYGAALLTVNVLAMPVEAQAAAPMLDNERGVLTIAPVLEKVTPGVVNISVITKVAEQPNPLLQDPFFRRFFGGQAQPQQREAKSAGSGVIIDAKDGLVLTNHHVIDNASKVTVTLKDRRKFEAEIIGSDPATDIALLKIEPENLTVVPFGKSDLLRVGDVVIAVGNPFGIGQTVTSGIVSALGRSGLSLEGYQDFIQTDASINPGNSGGALINTKGELIGINTAIIGPGGGNVGIGFAVPSDMAKSVMAQLEKHGEVRRGMLGVIIQDLTPEIADAMNLKGRSGAIITRVQEDSPADKAGIKAGDVLVGLNDKPLKNSTDLRNRIGLTPVGEKVSIRLMRDGKEKTVTAKIENAKHEKLDGAKALSEFSGAAFENSSSTILVKQVQTGSPAWKTGLREGDEILSVNRKRVSDLDEFKQEVSNASNIIIINLIRQGQELVLVIQR